MRRAAPLVRSAAAGLLLAGLGVATEARAEQPAGSSAWSDFLSTWSRQAAEARASQPHWLTPLMSPTPVLTQLLRSDVSYQWLANGARSLNVGGNKGVFLIPGPTTEVDIGVPTFEQRYGVKPAYGLLDWQFLQVKQRLASADEQHGAYVVSAGFAAQAPTGAPAFTNGSLVLTPTLAGGKGFGDLNLQATSGLAIPTDAGATVGTAWLTNLVLQYRWQGILWPEFEVNWTYWLNGSQRGGLSQLFFTVGALFGPLPIGGDRAIMLGVGYQFAVAPPPHLEPVLTPTYQNNLVFSARMQF